MALYGLAAVFAPEHEYDDRDSLWIVERLRPGCFDEALRDIESGEVDLPALVAHDRLRALGTSSAGALRVWADAEGLRYRVALDGSPLAVEVAEMVRAGEIAGSSIRYMIFADSWRCHPDGIHVIREVRRAALVDVGPCDYPAHVATTADLVDDASPRPADRMWTRTMRMSERRANDRRSRAMDVERVRSILVDARERLLANRVGMLPVLEARRDVERDPGRRRRLEILVQAERIELDETRRALDRLEALIDDSGQGRKER